MTIASEVSRIQTAKAAIMAAINEKGGELTAEQLIDDYPAAIAGLPSGGGGDFYKCASVDTANKTWTGCKAFLTDGVYSFEANVTSGLTFTEVVPKVNSIYTSDALCKIAVLYDGSTYIFYDDFTDSSSANTGETRNIKGSILRNELDGVTCLQNSDSGYGIANYVADINVSTSFSMSIWFHPTALSGGKNIFGVGNEDSSWCVCFLCMSGDKLGFERGSGSQISDRSLALNQWNYLTLTLNNNSQINVFLNGETALSCDCSFNLPSSNTKVTVGGWLNNGYNPYGYFAKATIWDYVLTQDEIQSEYAKGVE